MNWCALFLFCLSLFIPSYAKNIALDVTNELELKVVTEMWPPFIVPEKVVSGIVTDHIRKILKYSDITYDINIYPWKRSYHLATTKPNILIYSIFRTEMREPLFHWFCPIYKETPIRIYKLASNKANIDSLTDLKSSIIGVMRGDNSHDYLLQKGFEEGVNLDISANEETNLKKLIKGRVDAIVQSEKSLRYRLNALGVPELEVSAGFPIHQENSSEHCMALSLGTKPDVIKKVRKGFKRWQQEKDDIRNKIYH